MQIKSCLRRCEKEIFKGFTTCCAFYEFHDHKLYFLPLFKLEIFDKLSMKKSRILRSEFNCRILTEPKLRE